LISIIIPTYNASATINNTLESIACQTYKNYQTILIDSKSTDNTINIIRQYTDLINVQLISEKDNGIYDAMNKGINASEGNWLYFMGADDTFIDKNVLKKIAFHLNGNNKIVYGNIMWVPSGLKEEGEWGYQKFLKMNINHQRIFYHVSLFKEYGNFNTIYKVSSDHELNIRLFCNSAIQKKYVDIDITYYSETGFSANKIDEDFWENWKAIVQQNFSPYLSQRKIYGSLGWYCWYNLNRKKYRKAFKLFCSIFLQTGDLKFVKHTLSQVSKRLKL
jgi:glycosyltransferase involved in cell wall biosynthesis